MTRHIRLVGTIVVAGTLVLVGTHNEAVRAQGKSDDEVKITFVSKLDQGKQTITLTLKVNEGWHIYANPVGNDDLAAAATTVKVAKAKPKDVKIAYPAGKENKDKVLGKYHTYEGEVKIPVTVERAAGDTEPLEVSVRFMACSKEGMCKLPATVKLTVK